MPIERIERLERDLGELVRVVREGPAAYLLNGRKKWTLSVVGGVMTIMIGQALLGSFYFLVKAPTVEWVEQRIDEKIKSGPITREAELRVKRNEDSIASLKSDIDNLTRSNIKLETQMASVVVSMDQLIKEVRYTGLSRGSR